MRCAGMRAKSTPTYRVTTSQRCGPTGCAERAASSLHARDQSRLAMICSSVKRLLRIDPSKVRIGKNNWIRWRGSRQTAGMRVLGMVGIAIPLSSWTTRLS